jgi:hypothetical protein
MEGTLQSGKGLAVTAKGIFTQPFIGWLCLEVGLMERSLAELA